MSAKKSITYNIEIDEFFSYSVFASWDAEEYGLVGSVEWVEEHTNWLVETNVAYLNIDVAVSGPRVDVAASPELHTIGTETFSKVVSPNLGAFNESLYSAWQRDSEGVVGVCTVITLSRDPPPSWSPKFSAVLPRSGSIDFTNSPFLRRSTYDLRKNGAARKLELPPHGKMALRFGDQFGKGPLLSGITVLCALIGYQSTGRRCFLQTTRRIAPPKRPPGVAHSI